MLLHLCQGLPFGFQHLSVIINLFRDMNDLSRSETELFFPHQFKSDTGSFTVEMYTQENP
jgi:hypothetical protein